MKYVLFILLVVTGCLLTAQDSVYDTVRLKSVIVSAELPSGIPGLKTRVLDTNARQMAGFFDLGEVLSSQSPVFIKSYGPGMLQTLSFRGMGASQTKVFVNGIRINSPSLGQTDLTLIPMFLISGVGLKYGNASMTEAPGGIGGAIMLQAQQRATAPGSHIKAEIGLGSMEEVLINAGYRWQGKRFYIGMKTSFDYSSNKFFYPDITQEGNPTRTHRNAETYLFGNLIDMGYTIGPHNWLGFNFLVTIADRKVPPPMTTPDLVEGLVPVQRDSMMLAQFLWKGSYEKLQTDAVISYAGTILEYDSKWNNIFSKTSTGSLQGRLKATWNVKDFVALEGNLNIAYDHARNDNYLELGEHFMASLLAGANFHISKHLEAGVFLQPVVTGSRIEPFLPLVSMAVMPGASENFIISANWARNINWPTLNDLYWNPGGNPGLKPEESNQGELSVVVKRKPGHDFSWKVDASGFYGTVKNRILWRPGSSGRWSAENVDEVETYGGEIFAGIEYRVNDWQFKFSGGYQYVHAVSKADDDETIDGRQLIYTPQHTAHWFAGAQWKMFSFGGNYSFTGKRYITTDNSSWLPAYDIFDMYLAFDFNLKTGNVIIFQINAFNLFNKKYMSVAWRPMPGSNMLLTLKYRFR